MKLKDFSCNDCYLTGLNCNNLENLKFLNCSNNVKNSDICCLNDNFTKLELDNCKSLEVLDASENALKKLELRDHPNLWNVACKLNCLGDLIIEKCPRLKLLEFSQQNRSLLFSIDIINKLKKEIEKNKSKSIDFILRKIYISKGKFLDTILTASPTTKYLTSDQDNILNNEKILQTLNFFPLNRNSRYSFCKLDNNLKIDKISRENLLSLTHSEKTKFYDYESSEPIELNKSFFPKLNEKESGVCNLGFSDRFENAIDERKKEDENAEQDCLRAEQEKNNPTFVTPPSPKNTNPEERQKYYGPANWYFPTNKQGIGDIEISQKDIIGHLVIENWPDLKKANVGNNDLTNLTVSNCPKLAWLNYAHNDFDKGVRATINKCPRLKPENIHNENCDGHYGWRPTLTQEEKSKKTSNVKLQNLLKQTSNLTWKEIYDQLKLIKVNEVDNNLYLIFER
ncbi:MAG: hypothetical protein mread185_000476 [Mycoplasmataceae bacterium]|nr:MAG: hypothetical protein mread185_000476 [Mycoplasmataceae bacterium]